MERIERHQKIVDFLMKLKDEDGNQYYSLKTQKDLLDRSELEKVISLEDTHSMVRVLCETFGIMSGSAGDINFYKLLESYLLDESKRKEINKCL